MSGFLIAFRLPYFNSRPSARGDDADGWQRNTLHYFNSRPSARGDGKSRRRPRGRTPFQFTPLREGRRTSSAIRRRHWHFNSRPSARGDAFAR